MYLSLDQLGVVLKHLSQQLPGINVHQKSKQYMHVFVSYIFLYRICYC